jgi:hypothetical protein
VEKLMVSNFDWPTPENQADEKLLSNVRKYGCHIVTIWADEIGPLYTFSIGLFLNYKQPEVIIFGLEPETASILINDIRDLAASGERFFAGDRTDKLLMGNDACFIEVPVNAYPDYLGIAIWFYRSMTEPFPCVQLVWPDRAGKFPWQAGYDSGFKTIQPMLKSFG